MITIWLKAPNNISFHLLHFRDLNIGIALIYIKINNCGVQGFFGWAIKIVTQLRDDSARQLLHCFSPNHSFALVIVAPPLALNSLHILSSLRVES